MKVVNQPLRKKDAMQLVTGQPVYVDDVTPRDCLCVKLLRSPHANAIVKSINKTAAMKVPGMEAIFTWEDVDQDGRRYTQAGQTYPEASPYDRLVIDRHVRFVGDVVAILAGADEKCVDKAMKLVKVEYEVLEPVLDFHTAKDNPVLVHPEDNWESLAPVGADNKRNLCAHDECGNGDIDAVLADCDVVIDRVYHTQACQQAMMETFRTYCEIDTYGRLHIISSTQIVFHTRRIVANALHIPKSKVRVTKPRIGGGFGAKQTAVSAVYPAFVTWMTKKPSKIIFSRVESQIASSPRHEMEMHVRLGANKDGIVRGIDLHTLSNTGAYGEHGPTTVGLSGHKSIPLYGKADAFRFTSDVVYTNHMSAGAYRGYGATQGLFAVESAVNELANILGMDPFKIREMNITHEGEIMPAYYGQLNTSCALDRCLARVHDMIDWDNKYPCRDMGNGKVRAVGMGMAMQGSGITSMDVGSATLKVNDEGFYTLLIGAADMGTGCDTTLAQIAAEVLECPLDNITTLSADTDWSPYDSGSYASSTTYVTGKATEKCALELRGKICALGAKLLGCDKEQVSFDGREVRVEEGENAGKTINLSDIATASMNGNSIELQATVTHSSEISPPPYMVGAAEIEVDTETGEVTLLDYAAAVDCGTPINPNLTRVQAEGGIAQGIGMTLTESVTYDDRGYPMENSLFQYKIPARVDIGKIRVEFENSYEGEGPFGAKSIGEVVINTPLPAISDAIRNAVGKRFYELPITPEKIAMAALEKK
ncbi:xanthine dehydrogenase family protein molybdopterin-binding subunit [Agathobaculum butyriciproducens]|uniref:xanthine dehydrogenase family protein molybdopterin-binding subunit n=1 Tax=Agathobaculum butyriciproducens TaxID=1628085 RepID=UPI001D060F60|nr:molybdopterin-dependent oxidoreductase [Agathobaculum butyriciproducens]MCQ5047241.1 molybdopterin-dependent oxidoreductase [Agathobaculum butyriciproducens]